MLAIALVSLISLVVWLDVHSPIEAKSGRTLTYEDFKID